MNETKEYYQKKQDRDARRQNAYTRLFKMVSVGVVDDPNLIQT